MTIEKRGLSCAEAMAYVGVKRRTFDTQWRPRLVGIPQGVTTIFDRQDLDRLFDEFKRQAAGDPPAANDAPAVRAHNGARNGRPTTEKGIEKWANKQEEFGSRKTAAGASTNGGAARDFGAVASAVLKRRRAGSSSS